MTTFEFALVIAVGWCGFVCTVLGALVLIARFEEDREADRRERLARFDVGWLESIPTREPRRVLR